MLSSSKKYLQSNIQICFTKSGYCDLSKLIHRVTIFLRYMASQYGKVYLTGSPLIEFVLKVWLCLVRVSKVFWSTFSTGTFHRQTKHIHVPSSLLHLSSLGPHCLPVTNVLKSGESVSLWWDISLLLHSCRIALCLTPNHLHPPICAAKILDPVGIYILSLSHISCV